MRRLLVGLVVLAVVAAGVLAASDGPLRSEVERRVAASLRTSVPFTDTPTVAIAGSPFAWHLVTGRFPSARIRAAGMPTTMGTTAVTVADVDLLLTDVRSSPEEVRAGSARGTARLAYADLSSLAGVPLGFEDGRLVATYRTSVAGLSVEARVSGLPGLDKENQTVSIVDPDVSVAGISLGRDSSRLLLDAVVEPVPLALEFGLRLDSVSPAADGLLVGYSGSDVAFPVR